MKHSVTVKVKNKMGLHARPATAIAKILQGCKSSVHFTYKKDIINAKSIMSILMLAAPKNSQIIITAFGEDAEIILQRLVDGFDTLFGEIN